MDKELVPGYISSSSSVYTYRLSIVVNLNKRGASYLMWARFTIGIVFTISVHIF